MTMNACKVLVVGMVMCMLYNQVNAKRAVACEHAKDDSVQLSCLEGSSIHIESTNYGRKVGLNNLCRLNKPDVKTCISKNSEEIIREKCDGHSKCTVKAANSVFGDPCRGVVKYLSVEYTCRKMITTVVACEHAKNDSAVLSCPEGTVIFVLFANYGRNGMNHVCPNLNKPEVKQCTSSNSMTIVRAKCQGKASCQVQAANSVFGDPCYGVVKYLEVVYECRG